MSLPTNVKSTLEEEPAHLLKRNTAENALRERFSWKNYFPGFGTDMFRSAAMMHCTASLISRRVSLRGWVKGRTDIPISELEVACVPIFTGRKVPS
jgi:hypothetical protein